MNGSRHDPARPGSAGPEWGQVLGGGLLFLVGLAGALLLAFYLARDLSLWVLGRPITATVDELYVEQIGDQTEGELDFRYLARYHFVTASGQVVANTTQLDVREWGGLYEGGPLDVVYFPPYPTHNRLEEGRFVPILACAYVPLVVVTWLALGLGWYLIRPGARRAWWFGRRR